MVYFVGAGPGAADLITVRGMRLLEQADVVIYAGSLVNPELLSYCKKECEIHNLSLIHILAVVHGGTIMAVLSSFTGGEYFDFQVKNGEGYETVLEWIQGSWKITSLTKI